MKFSTIVYKIQCYGIKGIIDYIRRYKKTLRLKKLLIPCRECVSQAQTGITLIGPFSTSTSLSKVMRDLATRLRDCAIPFQAIDTCHHTIIPETEYSGLLTPLPKFDINRYTHVIQMFTNFVPSIPGLSVSTIYFWEFESGLEHLYPDMTGDTLLAMSDFNKTCFESQKPDNVKSVKKILYPLRTLPKYNSNISEIRRRFGIPLESFVVYFNFDFLSSYYRKNPEGVIKAFARAFVNNENAILLFKTMRSAHNPDLHKKMLDLIAELGLSNRFVEVKSFLTQEDLIGLTNACDVYISLHRGEGFGLTLAEAMQLAKPVICTDYSATTEFCKENNAILIPYQLVPVRPEQVDTPEYKFVKQWADPSVEAAAEALKKLYDNPSYRQSLGIAGQRFISDYFSDTNFTASIQKFIKDR